MIETVQWTNGPATLREIRLEVFPSAGLNTNMCNSKPGAAGSPLETPAAAPSLWQPRHYNSPGLQREPQFKPTSCFVPLTQLFDLLCPQKATSHVVADFQGATSNATRPTKLKRAVLEISKEDFFWRNFQSYLFFFFLFESFSVNHRGNVERK